MIRHLFIAVAILLFGPICKSEELVDGRRSLVFDTPVARLVVDLGGGAIGEFRSKSIDVNPLSWSRPKPGETSIRGFGHFLCLDRWGPASDAEAARGMPYHGEASNVEWTIAREIEENEGVFKAEMRAKLPKAGLSVRRIIQMSRLNMVFKVREEVTNDNALGRVFNIVQHPTIAPPFLDENTIVNCNGKRGFAQGGALPMPEEPSDDWPNARQKNGQVVDIRWLKSDPNPNVVSYAIEDSLGWVTAASPDKGLLIGYFWRTSDYPWVSLWRDVHEGKPAARGLEFGTTGLHQPFPILLKKNRIWDRPLFEYIDAGETIAKTYTAFLCPIPTDFKGVDTLRIEREFLHLHDEKSGHEFIVSLRGLTD
jgi:D-hexose-6-phosphate mutarotase